MTDKQYEQDELSQKLQNSSLGGNQAQEQQQNPYGQYQQGQKYFNPNTANTFIPGQYGGYGQAGYSEYSQDYQNYAANYGNVNGQNQAYGYQNFNNRGGYNNYGRGGYYNNNANAQPYQKYQQYQQYQQQPQQGLGMSLADFQKQQKGSQAALNKPKKSLKLASSSGIKLANATKAPEKKTEGKTDEQPKEAKTETAPETEKKTENNSAPQESTEVKASSSKTSTTTPEQSDKETTLAPAKAEKKAESKPTAASKSAQAAAQKEAVTAEKLAKEQEDEVDEEVIKDMFGGKDHVSIIFMGHVDAGKSTMGGNILYLTGSVDKRTVEKYEREAKDAGRQGWYLSWVMDTNKEERSDGKTIEVGKAYFETEKRRYTILDAPGHKMYVSEMIGGASQADVGILVISARKGEYETGFEKGGQTREHALLAKTQGVNKIVVVVNKMDDPTVGWSEERYKDCTTKLGQFLKGIGYAKDDIVYMPVSGYTGAGIKDRVSSSECPWYSGPSLLEYLDNMKTVDRRINGPFMLPISGKMKDLGTIVEGKIESGHVKKNTNLLLMPNRASIEVVTIYNETEQECEAAYCGEQVRLKIKGIEEEELAPGYVLTSPSTPVKTITRFEAQIAIVELKSILSNGFSCVMHLHTAIEEVKFVQLKHKLEKGTNRKSKKPPAFAKKGMKIIALLEASAPVCAETYADYPQLGRFTLRDQGTTIAIGKITKLC